MTVLPDLSLNQRKAVILACRAQSFPTPGTSFGDQVLEREVPQSIWNVLDSLSLLESPLLSNFLLTLVLSAPMPIAMVNRIKEEMVAKEMKVMESEPLQSRLNYDVFFEAGHQHEALHPDFAPNEPMATLVHNRLVLWRQSVQSRTLYPRMSHKTVSRETARRVAEHYNWMWGDEDEHWTDVTQVTLENIYHHEGVSIGGPCEMRQKWYTAIAVPRTYYAGGGDAYQFSKYLQEPFNLLVDTLACTERYSRVNPSRLLLPDDSLAIIYDLSSFTSNCHEQRQFLYRLASFCDGTLVTIMDGQEGPVLRDLGEMIRVYTHTLNDRPAYSIERIWGTGFPELFHHQAGFLGVFGNIATCTFLHGAVVLQACSSEDELNIAGDDGIFPGKSVRDALVFPRPLGVLALEKVGSANEEGAVHLKRPIKQAGRRLLPGRMLIWPSPETVPFNPKSVDPRYPYLGSLTRGENRHAVASSVARFLYHLSTFDNVPDQEREFVFHYLEYVYRELHLPFRGSLPQCGGDLTLGFVAELQPSNIGRNPYEVTIRSLYRGCAQVTERRLELEQEETWFVGAEFIHRSDARLSYLEKMGYLEKEPLTYNVIGEDGLYVLLKEFDNPGRDLYAFRVIVDIPQCFR